MNAWRTGIVQVLAGLVVCLSAAAAASGSSVDHAVWDQLLQRHVREGLVDYDGIKAQHAALDGYLATLGGVVLAELPSREAQLALWINAYNACVIRGVLHHQPLRSVKEVVGFFTRRRYRVAGREWTLNEMEDQARSLGDIRVHFALVCASSSCPTLRSEAYAPQRLEAQLADQTTQFLADPQRGLRVQGNTLWVSMIFKWHETDFVPRRGLVHRLTPAALLTALEPYLDKEAAKTIRARRLGLKFIPYDWTLNARPGR